MNRGEIWWYELPDSGRRPGCILTRQAAIPVLNSLLVAPATRTVRDIPTEVRLGPDDGMPTDCALSLDNVLPVPKVLMTERITRLSPAKMAELCNALNRAAAC
ncbi:MAG: type II toxin-antitoxin system PemK/MazF family toxin [Solirubrobacteraceae bacterium]